MKSRLDIVGIDDFLQQLKLLPGQLTAQAVDIVTDETDDTANELKVAYPIGPTGDLVMGVSSRVVQTSLTVYGEVQSAAPEAVWWEFGTADRHTREGWARGRAPHHKDEGLVPIAARHRRSMIERLIAMVEATGLFTVTDRAA